MKGATAPEIIEVKTAGSKMIRRLCRGMRENKRRMDGVGGGGVASGC